MNPIVIALLIAVGLLVIYFVFIKKKDEPEQIEAKPEPKELKKAPAKAEEKAQKPAAKPKAASPTKADKKPEPKPAPEQEEEDDDDGSPDEEDAPESAPVQAGRPSRGERPAPLSKRTADVAGLRRGLGKVRESGGFFGRLKALFTGRKEIDPSIVEDIEEVLLTSDVGVKTTEALVAEIRDRLEKNELTDPERVWESLRERAREILQVGGGALALSDKPTVVMVVGVNGAGKTTTIGKLATKLKAEGRSVVLAAGDTFRAAAVQQLKVWGDRVGCDVISGKDGADPGAVIFDAIKHAEDQGADVVLADTAGRLHTKTNLMEELKRVSRTMGKAMPGAPHETLLVLDATNGQNAVQQAAMFKEALPLSGIVLTKLDGTAKGGVILGICSEHELPVRYIGIGERSEDLRDFMADEFVEAMLGTSGDSTDEAA